MIDAFGEFGISDAFDVAIVAALLYAGISWLRRSQAALVALGMGLLGIVYLTAQLFDLHLTTWVFHGFFAAAALVLVVIFQEELRQGFEELAAFAMGQRADHRPRMDAADVLALALTGLAREKNGALVVLAGMQKLERHLHGGEPLGGQVSAALLESLFDPHSPGHDGAVVIEDREVTRFGAHLPLARGAGLPHGLGTRHSAAYGLSERTDALCLVVSEERGTISAARHGVLRPVGSGEELARLIASFYRERRALRATRPSLRSALQGHRLEKAAAVLLALGLWLIVTAAGPGPK
jgi:diadenylate cyclase